MVNRAFAYPVALAGSLLLMAVPLAAAAQTAPTRAGTVISLRGTLDGWLDGNEASPAMPLKRGAKVPSGAVLATGENSVARLLMADDTIIDLGSKTRLRLHQYDVQKKTKRRSVSMRLMVGRLWARVTKALTGEEHFEVDTGNAVAGVRGTQFVVDVDAGGAAQITCVTGSVGVRDAAGGAETLLEPMQQGIIAADGGISRGSVSSEQVKAMANSVKTGATLDSAGAQMRAQRAETAIDQGAGKAGAAAASDGGLLDEMDSDMGAPPLDLEPSSGMSTITIRAVVQE